MPRKTIKIYKQQIVDIFAQLSAAMSKSIQDIEGQACLIRCASTPSEIESILARIQQHQQWIAETRTLHDKKLKAVLKEIKSDNKNQLPAACQALIEHKKEVGKAWKVIEKDTFKRVDIEVKRWQEQGPVPISHAEATHWLKEAEKQVADGLRKMAKPLKVEAASLVHQIEKNMVTHINKPLAMEAKMMAKKLGAKWEKAKNPKMSKKKSQ